jgi:hypothetical protein
MTQVTLMSQVTLMTQATQDSTTCTSTMFILACLYVHNVELQAVEGQNVDIGLLFNVELQVAEGPPGYR